jgi:esterase/lipase
MKTIILLHGAIGAKDQLEPLANQLKQQGCNVYTLSLLALTMCR